MSEKNAEVRTIDRTETSVLPPLLYTAIIGQLPWLRLLESGYSRSAALAPAMQKVQQFR